jgi:hypothetical protein
MQNFIVFVISLITVHFLYDCHLQSRFIAENKNSSYFILFIHSFVWASSLWLTKYFWLGGTNYLWLIILLLSHGIMDKWKGQHTEISYDKRTIIDQSFHIFMILLFALFG